MMHRSRESGRADLKIAIAMACALLTLFGGIALGHGQNAYKNKRPASNFRIDAYFHPRFPTGEWRSRVIDGAKTWNRLGRLHYVAVHRQNRNDGRRCPDIQGDPIGIVDWASFQGSFPGSAAAYAINFGCKFTSGSLAGKAAAFRQFYNSDYSSTWYVGTGDAFDGNDPTRMGEGSPDLWSVATHEMGHVAGAKHYTDYDPACSFSALLDGTYETMCRFHWGGTELQRTLGVHDAHTFKRVYGAR